MLHILFRYVLHKVSSPIPLFICLPLITFLFNPLYLLPSSFPPLFSSTSSFSSSFSSSSSSSSPSPCLSPTLLPDSASVGDYDANEHTEGYIADFVKFLYAKPDTLVCIYVVTVMCAFVFILSNTGVCMIYMHMYIRMCVHVYARVCNIIYTYVQTVEPLYRGHHWGPADCPV